MQAAKIDIVDQTTTPRKKNLLEKFVAAVSDKPFIDGNNYFTGVPQTDKFAPGTFGMTIDNQKDWERAWSQLGMESPGKLPRGAVAHLEFISDAEKLPEVSLARIVKTDSELELAWDITLTPAAEKGSHGAFAMVILPGKLPTSSTYKILKPAVQKTPRPST